MSMCIRIPFDYDNFFLNYILQGNVATQTVSV